MTNNVEYLGQDVCVVQWNFLLAKEAPTLQPAEMALDMNAEIALPLVSTPLINGVRLSAIHPSNGCHHLTAKSM